MARKPLLEAACYPLVAAALASPLFVECGGGTPNAAAVAPPACPELADADAALAYDWAGRYAIDAASANRIRAGVAAALDLRRVAAQLDADLKTGCGGLAIDLGATGDFKTGKEACDAALKALQDTKSKLRKATIALDVTAPKCGASMDVVGACVAKCDARPGGAKAECEPGKAQGTCAGSCSGVCDVQGGAKCAGTCSGKCDGKCKGKCEGVASTGVCSGTCDGKCTGACTGSCALDANAACTGTCTGSCDVEMKSPRCTGDIKPPTTSAECGADCAARAEAKVECTPAHVGVTVRARDKALAKKLKTALENDLPMVLKVSLGMGERAKKLAGDVKTVIEGAEDVAKTAASGAMGAALAACVARPFSEGISAVGSVDSSVSASVGVSAGVR